jgi:hypothetical protein
MCFKSKSKLSRDSCGEFFSRLHVPEGSRRVGLVRLIVGVGWGVIYRRQWDIGLLDYWIIGLSAGLVISVSLLGLDLECIFVYID